MVEYWLNFVGKGIYKRGVFEREANRIGVQRAIPFSLLRSFAFGDPVLLAYHTRDQYLADGLTDMRTVSRGSGEIIGYFNVESLVNNLPEKILNLAIGYLDVQISEKGEGIERRGCGSYSVGRVWIVNNSWGEIIDAIERACKITGDLDPRKFKYFLKGSYVPFRASMVIEPINFTRGFHKVEIEDLDPKELRENARKIQNIVWIYDYEKRTYLRKDERRALENQSIEEFEG